MKLTLAAVLASIAFTSGANSATVNMTPGFGVGVVPSSLPAWVAVGSYIGFTPLATTSISTLVAEFDFFAGQTRVDRLGGSYTASDSQFNSQPIYLLVGNGSDTASSTSFAIFETNVNFSADVTQADSIPLNVANTNFVKTTLVGSALPNAIVLEAVPEPSTLLLSAFGVLGLLRRRR